MFRLENSDKIFCINVMEALNSTCTVKVHSLWHETGGKVQAVVYCSVHLHKSNQVTKGRGTYTTMHKYYNIFFGYKQNHNAKTCEWGRLTKFGLNLRTYSPNDGCTFEMLVYSETTQCYIPQDSHFILNSLSV
jgi:hypothetical protein